MILLIGCFILILIISIHEFGHFIVGKFFGVDFVTFSIGMGPRIWKKRIGNTVYCFSILLIGGYVRAFSKEDTEKSDKNWLSPIIEFLFPISDLENSLYEECKLKEEHSKKISNFGFISYVSAGCLFNLIASLTLVTLYFNQYPERPHFDDDSFIGRIEENSSAYKNGFRSGDRIISVNGNPTFTFANVFYYILHARNITEAHILKVKRAENNKSSEYTFSVKNMSHLKESNFKGFLAFYEKYFSYKIEYKEYSLLNAFYMASSCHYDNLGSIFTMSTYTSPIKNTSSTLEIELDGFAGIPKLMLDTGYIASKSVEFAVMMFMAISVAIVIGNLLPIPGTDGFILLFFVLEKYFKITMPGKVRTALVYCTFTLMLFITTLLTIRDLILAWS